MRNRKWKKWIRSAARHDVPDVKEEIKSSDVYQNHITRALNRKPARSEKTFALRYVYAGAAAMVVLLLALFLPFTEDSPTSVYLDINPGIRLDLDEEDTVTELLATNPDGEDFLVFLDDLRGKPFDDAIDALVDAAIEQGHLSDEAPYIVYDVRGPSEEHRERILHRLEERLPEVASARIPDFAIMRGQGGDETQDEQERARAHGMSVMRLRLVEHIIEETEDFEFEDLKNLPIGDIKRIMEERDIPDHAPGPPSDRPGGPPS